MPVRLSSPEDVLSPATLADLCGPVESVQRETLVTSGFSSAKHERVHVRLRGGGRRDLILKRDWPARNWTAYRTGDTVGREASILAEPALAEIWNVFHCPYLAYAQHQGEIALLMEDLSEYLVPDRNEPIIRGQEDALLRALARLHARYWNSERTAVSCLAGPIYRATILGPRSAAEEALRPERPALFDLVEHGWEIALNQVPAQVRDLLLRPADVITTGFDRLPQTLLHGDAKVANIGFLPNGQVSAFDWAVGSTGVCTMDIGYYVAVNSGRLTRPKEAVIAQYRRFLEQERGDTLSNSLWEDMVSALILGGALMLLWSKALSLKAGDTEEWRWWVQSLEGLV